MAKRKEIKFQERHGALRGRQNGMEFWIWKDGLLDSGEKPEYFVVIFRKGKDQERVSTGGRRVKGMGGYIHNHGNGGGGNTGVFTRHGTGHRRAVRHGAGACHGTPLLPHKEKADPQEIRKEVFL